MDSVLCLYVVVGLPVLLVRSAGCAHNILLCSVLMEGETKSAAVDRARAFCEWFGQ